MTEELIVQREGHVLSLRLNRPSRKNAINLAMYTAMVDALEQARDSDVRVILLSGEGDDFTSGNDLADFASGLALDDSSNPIARFIYTLLDYPLPVVVAVQGVAVGIGTTLLLHSDLVYAAPSARFRLPFVNLGLCPEFASSITLPAAAGHARAAEWLLLGEFFSADDAKAAGIINGIEDSPFDKAMSQAQKLAAQPPGALRTAKQLMKAPMRKEMDDILKQEFTAFSKALSGPEFAEAAAAFFEKRSPDFSKF